MTVVGPLPTSRRGWQLMAGVTVLLSAASLFEGAAGAPGAHLSGLVIVFGAWIALACLVSYPFPMVGLVLVLALEVAGIVIPGMPRGGGSQLIASMFLVGFLAYRLPGRLSLVAWIFAGAVPATTLVTTGVGVVWEYAFYLLILGAAWSVGFLLQRERTRSAELAQLATELAAERERSAEIAVVAERARIARELHDAVAHSVSVMTLQIGVVRRRLDTLPVEQHTLQQAEVLGRRSVDELRRIVGLVRPARPGQDDLSPLPSLAQLDDLAEQVRATGTPVTLTRPRELPELGGALDMSAYRIVQESVTNALRHAPGASIEITVSAGRDGLELVVSDAGPSVTSVRPGNGLTGMQERVAMFGGTLTYSPRPGGGFVVRAGLPLATDPGRQLASAQVAR